MIIGHYLGRPVLVEDARECFIRAGWVRGKLDGDKKQSWFWRAQVKTRPWGEMPV